MRILITGAAGFIGFHLSKRLLEKGFSVFAYDDLNTYYRKFSTETYLIEHKEEYLKLFL